MCFSSLSLYCAFLTARQEQALPVSQILFGYLCRSTIPELLCTVVSPLLQQLVEARTLAVSASAL